MTAPNAPGIEEDKERVPARIQASRIPTPQACQGRLLVLQKLSFFPQKLFAFQASRPYSSWIHHRNQAIYSSLLGIQVLSFSWYARRLYIPIQKDLPNLASFQ